MDKTKREKEILLCLLDRTDMIRYMLDHSVRQPLISRQMFGHSIYSKEIIEDVDKAQEYLGNVYQKVGKHLIELEDKRENANKA
jgi:hypothetical protein